MRVRGRVLGEEEEDSVVEGGVLFSHCWGGEATMLREVNKYGRVKRPHEKHRAGRGGEL